MNGDKKLNTKIKITKIKYPEMIQPYKNIDRKVVAEKACINNMHQTKNYKYLIHIALV